ncbi:SaV-like [uncultured Caudovirales phage]|uniref:SaV-like n=1 Tax=uncultured Caudovirales phage TaxID=2100421 RepID=A0A6J5KHC6_9CAUD|nr:SaV-like [uncultured Caudovirales phage]
MLSPEELATMVSRDEVKQVSPEPVPPPIPSSIDHPAHYQSDIKCECGRPLECIDVVRTKNFCIGNAIKYIWRHEDKGGVADLRKAIWYLNAEIERLS